MPQGIAQPAATKGRAQDKEAHETEGIAIGGDGPAADQFAVQVRGDEGFRIGGPEQLGILAPGVPPFPGSPIDQQIHLGTSHEADGKGRGHGVLLRRWMSYQLQYGGLRHGQCSAALAMHWPS